MRRGDWQLPPHPSPGGLGDREARTRVPLQGAGVGLPEILAPSALGSLGH